MISYLSSVGKLRKLPTTDILLIKPVNQMRK